MVELEGQEKRELDLGMPAGRVVDGSGALPAKRDPMLLALFGSALLLTLLALATLLVGRLGPAA